MPTSRRSLADDIRSRSDSELTDLVLARPDLARPAPADLSSLAARASTRASVQRAVESLDRARLQVLEAMVVTDDAMEATETTAVAAPDEAGIQTLDADEAAGAEPAGQKATSSEADGGERAAVLALLGCGERPGKGVTDLVDQLVTDLWRAALLWSSDDGRHHVVRTVSEVLGSSVAGLGAPLRELRPAVSEPPPDLDALTATIEAAPAPARALLKKMTWGPAFGVLPPDGAGSTTAGWLIDHQLLVPVAADRVALPREVGLALRGGRLHRTTTLSPPELGATSVSGFDGVAGGSASELLTHLDELAAVWGAQPPRAIRSGGLSVRDLRATALSLDLDPERAAFVIELAHAAALVADDGELVPVWAPTPELDEWSLSEAGHRWAVVAQAWARSTRAAHLVGRRTATGASPSNALGPDVHWPAIRAIRREVLSELAQAPVGQAPDVGSVRDRLMWRRPLRPASVLTEALDAVLREAEWLGVTGRGALSSAGRALAQTLSATSRVAGPAPGRSGTDAAAEATQLVAAAVSAHLPAPVDHILVQADLTAVAPGPLEGSLAAFMRLGADVESRGGATVYRFTTDSVRRALDAGWTAAEFVETVRRSSRTPLPQPFEYLVADLARKHGQTRIGSASAYVRSDDVAVLETMLVARELGPLQLRRLAPTVLISGADPRVLVELLRDNGFTPVQERPDGAVVRVERPRRRAGSPSRTASPTVSPVDSHSTSALVAGLRAAEASADERRAQEQTRLGPRIPTTDPVVTLSVLRDAAAERHGVWVGVSDRLGGVGRHLIHPQRVEGGRVWATDESGKERSFSVHRITGATLDR